MALLLDTGFLYALADEDDDWHERAREFLDEQRDVLMVPISVVPEVCYLLHARLGPSAECAFVKSVVRRELDLQPLTDADLARTLPLLERYPFLGFVDASIVAIGERLKLPSLVTTDRRHFQRVKPKHCAAFALLP